MTEPEIARYGKFCEFVQSFTNLFSSFQQFFQAQSVRTIDEGL